VHKCDRWERAIYNVLWIAEDRREIASGKSDARRRDMASFWKRLICLFRGHDLASADEYGAELADGRQLEMHHCEYCGQAVWLTRSKSKTSQSIQAWKQLGI
jgi:hypothetical protein